jgi:hypothetical protein
MNIYFADKNEVKDNIHIEKVRSFSLSLRIIMYAPHEHRNGKKTKKYTHLILKTDNPDYHGHIDSGINVTPSTDLLQVKHLIFCSLYNKHNIFICCIN